MSTNRGNTNDTDKTGDVISWIIIVILLFAVPPLGLIFLLIKLGIFGNVKPKEKKKRSRLDKKTGKGLSTLLLIISIALSVIGLSMSIGPLFSWIFGGAMNAADFGWGILYLIGGVVSYFSRDIVAQRISRYKNYVAFIETRGVVPISDLAQMAGVTTKATIRDIQAMISNGYLDSGAYIDYELECLVLSTEDAEKLRNEIRGTQDNSPVTAEIKSDAVPSNQYAASLAELREVNSFIKDEAISKKVSHLEEITRKIFQIVEENPQKQPQLRRFMSYYLPTTLKLVRSYATLEKQGVKGENITSTKKSIDNILDTLSTGFEQQLDLLFKSDAIDIASDIKVLENLMQQDGLTGDKSGFQVAESGGF